MEKKERWERKSTEENEQGEGGGGGVPRLRPQDEIFVPLKSWGDRKRHTGSEERKREERTEVLRLHSPA